MSKIDVADLNTLSDKELLTLCAKVNYHVSSEAVENLCSRLILMQSQRDNFKLLVEMQTTSIKKMHERVLKSIEETSNLQNKQIKPMRAN